MLVRDPDDRVLMCQLTYKQDWDLPGGVVEVEVESPQVAVSREVSEELGLDIKAGNLRPHRLAAPVERLGRRALPGLRRRRPPGHDRRGVVPQEREIRAARSFTAEQVRERAADFTAQRSSPPSPTSAPGAPAYTESGR